MQKFHEVTNVGVVLLLVRHDPSLAVAVVVTIVGWRLFKKNYQKELVLEKELSKE